MSRMHRFIVLIALLALWLPLQPTPTAQATNPLTTISLSSLRTRLLYLHEAGRKVELELALKQLKSRSAFEAKLWRAFLRDWDQALSAQRFSFAAPHGLPRSQHAFVVLGSGNSAELTSRAALAEQALEAYPTSVAVLSGGKATDTKDSEAARLRKKLVAAGIDPSRLLLEEKSASTVGNAIYSVAVMKAHHLTSYTLISDASHLRRARVLFEAAELQDQYRSKKPLALRQLGNVAVPDTKVTNPASVATASYITSNVASVLQLYDRYIDMSGSPPARATLTGLTAHPQRKSWPVGSRLDRSRLSATARFNQGKLGVAKKVTVKGFKTRSTGTRHITVTYRYRSVTKKVRFTILVVRARTRATLQPSATKAVRRSTRIRLTAHFTTATGVRPTGSVQILLNGERIKTKDLRKADRGTLQYRLPTLSRLGKNRLTVVYSGNSKVTAVTRTVTIRVVRH